MKGNFYHLFRSALAVILVTWCQFALAQGNRITGQVTGPDGSIPGVNIVLKGTTTGSTTDADGKFSISASPNAVLVVSAIGYQTREVTVGNQSLLNISLQEDVNSLNEVVVTGYTTDSKRETTGAIATVKARDLTATPSGNVEQQLQGRVAGVTVITNGQPGTASQIRVRGFGTFGNNSPLYIVDGVPVGGIDFLNPGDIENTSVLKDAAAASIYGARAASGVIVITTKKGQRSARRMTVTYDGLYGVTDPGTGQKMLNPTDFATWTYNAFKNDGFLSGKAPVFNHKQFGPGPNPVLPDYINVGGRAGVTGTVDLTAERAKYNIDPNAGPIYQVVRANKQGTDWYKEITRVAPIQRHSLGFSGGTETSRYYVGLSAQDQQGILLSNSFKRYAFRVNTEFDVFKNLRFGENLQFTYLQVLGQSGDAANGRGTGVAADENDILQAFRMPSIIPVYDEFGGYAGTAAKDFGNPRNPVANRNGQADDRGYGANAFGNMYLEYDPIPGLTLRSSLGGQYFGGSYRYYSRLQYENSENNSAFGYGEGSSYFLAWTLTNTAAYKQKFGMHNVDVIVGQEALNTGAGRGLNSSGQNPFSTDLNYINITNVGARQTNSGQYAGVNFYSLFAQGRYNFNDKYYVTGVVRRDGSSRFGATNRYGIFPAFSAAWRVTSEPFMKSIPAISDLKLRVGYGTMGNSNNVSPENQYSLYGSSLGNSAYDLNGTNGSTLEGYYRTRIGNPNAKWETSITQNIGVDAAFLNGKVEVSLDLWQRDTKDLLIQLPVTATAGSFASAPAVNAAQMVNKGIDLLINVRGRLAGDVNYEATLTGGYLDNKITDAGPGQTYLTNINPGYRGITPIRNQVGQSISAFYGYKVVGLFQNTAEVTGAAKQEDAAPGRFRYADLAGLDAAGKPTGPDGKIDASDRTYLGSPVPKFQGGFNFKLTYKNFDVSSYFNTSIGNKIFNQSRWFTDFYPSFAGAAISARVLNSWTPTNTGATIPIFESGSNFSTNTQSNSFYIEDGSYLRMQNLTVGYTLPGEILGKLKMQRLRISASTTNLFTVTGYTGLDPAVGGAADTTFGIDIGNYPVTRGYNFGLGLTF
jgi:TonB-dependent starch-binding outer membrane protein SusC